MSDAQAKLDSRMMLRALRSAERGDPSPNPHVGAVVARGDDVISIGHHAMCGGPHAEVVALKRAGERARGATLYVSFEPCNHHGRTPPCTEAIIAAGISRVVVGCEDPAPHVPGSAKRLRAAGIEVVHGVERTRAHRIIASFETFMLHGRPHVTLKAAVTLDGKLATKNGDSRWITGEPARKHAHRMRAQADAVLIGVGTVLADDPELTVRHVRGRDPLRVVLDSKLRTPRKAKLVTSARSTPTLIIHGKDVSAARAKVLEQAGVELAAVRTTKAGTLSLADVMRELRRREVVKLLVEGGSTLHGALLDAKLVDRAAVFVAPRILGDASGMSLAFGAGKKRMADAWQLRDVEVQRLGDDVLITGDVLAPER